MNKIFILFALLTITLVGCKSELNCQNYCTTNSSINSTFNQETYVWESLLFPTNRTSYTQ